MGLSFVLSSDHYEKVNGMVPLTDKSIYIIGPMKLQNALMAFFLQQATGAKSLALDYFSGIEFIDSENMGQQKLVLLDCLEKDLESLLPELEGNGHRLASQDLVGLFNIRPGLGIENKILARGIRGFFYEQDPLEIFPKGVRTMFNGEIWLSRKIMTDYILKGGHYDFSPKGNESILTTREIEIITMIATGAANADIADKLCISCHTVKTHLYNIFKKINVPNRLQAALWVAKNL
jgi:DNA-binding CsgD family transcriptional regulator